MASQGKRAAKKQYSSYRGGRKGFDRQGGVHCKPCFEKSLEIDLLKEENKRLKMRLRGREKSAKTQGAFGNSTPSSQIPIKENTLEENRQKKGGATPGHTGHGRSSLSELEAHEPVRELDIPPECPDCHVKLYARGVQNRTLVDVTPMKAKRVLYHCKRGMCPQCFRVFTKKPQALAKTLYGNELIAQAATLHYVQGVSLGRILEIFGSEVTEGGLIQAFHRLGKECAKAMPSLIEQYRKAPVKHADETGWRTDGKRGYAWVFCSPETTLLQFRETRAAHVAHQILGKEKLPGVLVVDRYGGYNQVNCEIQYCYAHLLRETEKLSEDFPENEEVEQFSGRFAGLLSDAMRLRGKEIADSDYYREAGNLEEQIKKLVTTPALHLGIQAIQRIFIQKEHRLYHWVKDRNIPAENNRAEREIRPTVIARKVSLGSQSEQGARTRTHIMSVLYTVKKRLKKENSTELWLKEALDRMVLSPDTRFADLIPEKSTPGN